jgi:hypothetical protein
MSENPMNNNQTIKKGRGGYRKNAGRKKGAGEKLRASALLNEIYRTNKRSFAQLLVDELNKSILSGDTKLTAQYLQFIGNKVISDKVDVDHTTLGQPIQTVFNFPQRELVDWNPEVSFKYESNDKD